MFKHLVKIMLASFLGKELSQKACSLKLQEHT